MHIHDTYYNLLIFFATILLIGVCFLSVKIYRKVCAFFHQQIAMRNLAYTDQLTGFRNFPKFVLDAQRLLKKYPQKKYAIWSYDIKKFHLINAIFGSATGDKVLKRVSTLFDAFEEKDAAFCRNLGDQFVGIRAYSEKEELISWFSKLITLFDDRKVLSKMQFPSDYTMGFYCIEECKEQLSIKDMVNYASYAKSVAKAQTRNNFCFFSAEMKQKLDREAMLLSDGYAALSQEEFTFVVQPKVSIDKDKFHVIGGEVLVRWNHPSYGLIPPSEFVPLFEANGLIVELDRNIFEQACSWYAHCRRRNIVLPSLAINVSRQGPVQDDFVDFYSSVKHKYDIEDNVLEIEITEGILLEEFYSFRNTLLDMQNQGFICSLDDFGSGYSSLNVLQNLPINILKLDALFFRNSIDVERMKIIISTVIQMAHRLGVQIVAEGIDSSDQVNFLQKIGCDIIQGYIFSKPLSQGDFIALLSQKNRCIEMRKVDDTSVHTV